MSAQLTALDATFLELEQADPSAHMHIGAVLVFAPPAHGGPPALPEVRRRLALRLDALPRFRQRLSEPTVGGRSFPRWEPDPSFDLGHHVRRAALPAPGDATELLDWAGDFYSHRLDRARPLWEVVILEGLEDDRWAICTKTHHCLVDGVGSIDAGSILLDAAAEADADVRRAPPSAPADGHAGLLTAPWAVVKAGAHLARHPLDTVRRAAALGDLLIRDELVAAPRTSLNVPIGKHRRLASVGVPLDDVKAIKNALGGTVNDVVLAAVSGGLRELLVARSETPPQGGLRAMVPVNVRAEADRMALGNRISSLFVHLPVDEPDALLAYERVRLETAGLKRSGQALGSSTLLALADLAPPILHSVIARSLFASRLFNVTVTNVPGPQDPLFAFGARLVDAIPLVPLAAEHAVGVAVLSLDGQVVFCLNCDRDAVPDAAVAARGIEATLERLAAAAAPVA
jgi:diacylglycerol O-acyltransferase / wax synthase